MAWVDAFADEFSTTIQRNAWTGFSTDGYAAATFSTSASTYAAREVGMHRLVRSFEGIEELSTTTVWVASASTFNALDKWTLANGDVPSLLSVETLRDEDGVTHSKLGFGS